MCEWHLGRNLRQHLPDEILADRWHPITKALPDAFHSLNGWDRLEQAIEAERTWGACTARLALAVKWIDSYGQVAKAQIPTRDPHGINSTGPVSRPCQRSTAGSGTASARSPTARASPSCSI